MYIDWPGFSATNTLVIPVDRAQVGIRPYPLELAGRVFKPKQEAHITVLGSSLGTKVQQVIGDNPALQRQLSQTFESIDWTYTRTSDFRHLRRKRYRPGTADVSEESVIMLVKMEAMDVFYQKLKDLDIIDKDVERPPAHVTLYTLNCDMGIGVHSEIELTELTLEKLSDYP